VVKADDAASAVWIAHGLVMNGGVLHCVGGLSKRELRSAIAGYRFFGLPAAAEALEQAVNVPPEDSGRMEPILDARYNRAIPGDSFLDAQMSKAFPADVPPRSAALVGQQAIDAAIALFIEESSSSDRLSTVPGKTREQHRAHDRVEAAIRDLLRHWRAGGHEALLGLLRHSDGSVRSAAATYLAVSDPELAIPVLKKLDGTGSPGSLNAFGTLFAIQHGRFPDPLERLRSKK
jgi:hypothetical protein